MNLTQNEKDRFADDIALETMIRVLSLTVAREDNPEDADEINTAIEDLKESRDKFLLLLPNVTTERRLETAQYGAEEKMKRADRLLSGLKARPQGPDFWDSINAWTDRSAFDADRFCDTADEDLDLLPF